MAKKSNKSDIIPIKYTEENFNEIKVLISEYSDLYLRFENLQIKSDKNKTKIVQESLNLLAGGDQKTGVIGEYYAARYIQSKLCPEKIYYAVHGAPYDIKY